ncbi:hypothetical protein T492DRAFT_840412 [Pavlovales sp. CCMP2436]|nr:hypothetical protein T492DRAFT_840412 [Pavlovales sp. CCMP2436]
MSAIPKVVAEARTIGGLISFSSKRRGDHGSLLHRDMEKDPGGGPRDLGAVDYRRVRASRLTLMRIGIVWCFIFAFASCLTWMCYAQWAGHLHAAERPTSDAAWSVRTCPDVARFSPEQESFVAELRNADLAQVVFTSSEPGGQTWVFSSSMLVAMLGRSAIHAITLSAVRPQLLHVLLDHVGSSEDEAAPASPDAAPAVIDSSEDKAAPESPAAPAANRRTLDESTVAIWQTTASACSRMCRSATWIAYVPVFESGRSTLDFRQQGLVVWAYFVCTWIFCLFFSLVIVCVVMGRLALEWHLQITLNLSHAFFSTAVEQKDEVQRYKHIGVLFIADTLYGDPEVNVMDLKSGLVSALIIGSVLMAPCVPATILIAAGMHPAASTLVAAALVLYLLVALVNVTLYMRLERWKTYPISSIALTFISVGYYIAATGTFLHLLLLLMVNTLYSQLIPHDPPPLFTPAEMIVKLLAETVNPFVQSTLNPLLQRTEELLLKTPLQVIQLLVYSVIALALLLVLVVSCWVLSDMNRVLSGSGTPMTWIETSLRVAAAPILAFSGKAMTTKLLGAMLLGARATPMDSPVAGRKPSAWCYDAAEGGTR